MYSGREEGTWGGRKGGKGGTVREGGRVIVVETVATEGGSQGEQKRVKGD